MGIWSWFFPSPADRVARAQKLMTGQHWAEARLELLDVEHAEAGELLRACETELAKMNLEAAISWSEAGDSARVQHHLELADQFNHGGIDDVFRAARAEMREIRRRQHEEREREKAAAEARLLAEDPFGASGGPSWLQGSAPESFYEGADDEAAARLALIVESYAPPVRPTVGDLGPEFAQALLDFQDGRPDLAIQGLLGCPDDVAVVRYERARAAYALKDPQAAARELKSFGELNGGHCEMANEHSGVFLARCLAESGQVEEALRVVRSVRADNPDEGAVVFAQLLEMTGEHAEAEAVLAGLIRKYPSDPGLYKLLARVRVSGGQRKAAMAALESSLSIGHCTPGKCGYRPPDVAAMRSLALLYLEDGIEPERARELAADVQQNVSEPGWEDAYLMALVARLEGHPQATGMAGQLWERTPPGSPMQARLAQFLPAPA